MKWNIAQQFLKKELLKQATNLDNLKGIMLSERSLSQKIIYTVWLHLHDILEKTKQGWRTDQELTVDGVIGVE